MRKFITVLMAISVCAVLMASIAFAANYDGHIWTGKPNILGMGYYCTAAQNRSAGDVSTHWATAKTWKPSGSYVTGSATGNNTAVASTGQTKPYKGWGSYGETGWSTEGSFRASAWD